MPDITAPGTYTKETGDDWSFLGTAIGEEITLLFSDGTLPTTLAVGYTDDQGIDRIFEGGVITALPRSFVIGPLDEPIKLFVTGGSPNFNVIRGGTRRY
ncbi:MAG: hypothetical protein JAY90_20255 [Candidatus Thiodiazotropha lotti]|nr:hypothetical protein [Candidatus Thiodiazotropha lotti]